MYGLDCGNNALVRAGVEKGVLIIKKRDSCRGRIVHGHQFAPRRSQRKARSMFRWIANVVASAVIIAVLLFILVNFYVFSSVTSLDAYLYIFFTLSFLIDGLILALHMPRKKLKEENVSFDPKKLTILITCYNGEDVIADTIRAALVHVPANQIIVVSDASTDRSAAIASSLGVTVLVNPRNVHKAFSVSRAVRRVKTQYVLLLDDDTLIDKTLIPTSLMDEGYTAVAFNVMPAKEDNFLNALQRFEYRKSMQVAKNLRASAGAIGNVSGAIGLFRTKDLQDQIYMHSGEFGGEDEQRTILAHLYGSGKGVTYTNSIVETKPPSTLKGLFRQRAFSWDTSAAELFMLNWRILLHPRMHYLLKAEKASQMYVFLTDPLRMMLIWLIVVKPSRIVMLYGFYLLIGLVVWIKTERKDPLWVVALFPLFNLFTTACRFVAYFYWFKLKLQYLMHKKYHRIVKKRHMALEYTLVSLVVVVLWITSAMQFNSDLSVLRRMQTNRLDSYAGTELTQDQDLIELQDEDSKSNADSLYDISVAPSDTDVTIAYKVVEYYNRFNSENAIPEEKRLRVAEKLEPYIAAQTRTPSTMSLRLDPDRVERIVVEGMLGQQAAR